MKKNYTYLSGSMTVEMTYMMPLLLMVLIFSIRGTFYYHDKNIISGAAYEVVVVASTKLREKEKPEEQEIEDLFQERIRGKCILFSGADVQVVIEDEKISVRAQARRNKLKLTVEQKARVTDPERTVRKKQIIKRQVIINGTGNATD